MSSNGYIYVVDWDRYQHYKTRRPPWIKFYLDLLGNDEWYDLSPSNAKLLCVIWMLAGMHGNGRVRADQGWLNAQANTPRGSLERLSDAGFITVRASKAASSGASRSSTTETETEEEVETEVLSRELPSHAREDDQPKNGHTPEPCSDYAQRMITAWVSDDIIQRLTATDRALVGQAIDQDSQQIRQSMALVEKSSNPKAYLMTIAQKITATGTA